MKDLKFLLLNLIIVFLLSSTNNLIAQTPFNGLTIDSASNHGILINQPAQLGIMINDAGSDAIHIDGAVTGIKMADIGDVGLFIDGAFHDGIYVQNTSEFGIHVKNSLFSNFVSTDAGGNGMFALNSTYHGYETKFAGMDGFYANQPAGDGLHVDQPGSDGVYVNNCVGHALRIKDAGSDGVFVDACAGYGLRVINPGINGFSAINPGSYGAVISDAGYQGLRIQNSGDDGLFILDPGDDGIQVNHSGSNGSTTHAAYFNGYVYATNIAKGAGSFKIDHPLDPENKYLYHSFVESPDMMNIYNGNIILDENGEAIVSLPNWFEVLNRHFRYQLTSIGHPNPNLYISEKVTDLTFKIAGGHPRSEVSWMITGIRQDALAESQRIQVEVEKPEELKGTYLHDKAWAQKLGVQSVPGVPETIPEKHRRATDLTQ